MPEPEQGLAVDPLGCVVAPSMSASALPTDATSTSATVSALHPIDFVRMILPFPMAGAVM